MAGEHKQNYIEDDEQYHEQNTCQQNPTPINLRECGFHDHPSCLIELV
jgi:hypothetical protein